MELRQALDELRKEEPRKFKQTIDLIVNLKGINLKKDNINVIANLPFKSKDKKICGFLTKRSELVDSVTKPEFEKYKDKKMLKSFVKKYDFFIAHASLMPSVATTFGKVLGPAGKMPSPQLGVLLQENDDTIKELLAKISSSIKIRAKELSIKLSVANESMKDEEIIENVKAAYNAIVNALPVKKDNVKNAIIKFTMSKPLRVEIK